MGSVCLPAVRTAFDASKTIQFAQDPLYSLTIAFDADDSPLKVDLGVGAYRDGFGKSWVLPVVRKADERYRQSPDLNHDYLPIAGLPSFNLAAQKLILGNQSPAISDRRTCTFQTISGTGAIHLGGSLLAKLLPRPTPFIYVSSPSWPIHDQCFQHVGLPIRSYPYFNEKTKTLDFEGMMTALTAAPRGSVILLQACAHNPTGVDPTAEQWQSIARVMRERQLFPFFDSAYQGFATGQISEDNFCIRYFVDQEFELLVAQSFAKNLGLYGQRVGALHYVASPGPSAETFVERVSSQLSWIQRAELSSPPIYGAQVASIVLNDKKLFAEWEEDLGTMSSRIKTMRSCLRRELERLRTPGTWEHITQQIGMFSYTGLRSEEVLELGKTWHIYMAETGRISVAGLNEANVAYVARAINAVVSKRKQTYTANNT